jgi:hypothetical protein
VNGSGNLIPVLVSALASGKFGRLHITDPPELLELLEEEELLEELEDEELLDDELLEELLLDDDELPLFCPPQAAKLKKIAAR